MAIKSDSESWLTIPEVARTLRLDRRRLYAALGVLLVYRRPSPGRYEVSRQSADALKAAITADPGFLGNSYAQRHLRAAVRRDMDKLVEEALQAVGDGPAAGGNGQFSSVAVSRQ